MAPIRASLTVLTVVCCIFGGCAQPCVHQSMLLQENRRLENALYVTHAQLDDVKRENETLRRTGAANDDVDTGLVPPIIPGKSKKSKKIEDYDNAPPFELPKVEIPGDGGTKELPQVLKSSQAAPSWSPQR